jgi:hypothetical protein
MDVPQDKLRLRQVGRGFIICNDSDGTVIGRRLTKTYLDQNDRTYVKVNGQLELLTEQHSYLAVD